jgi:hypothetical protein
MAEPRNRSTIFFKKKAVFDLLENSKTQDDDQFLNGEPAYPPIARTINIL